VDAKTGENEEQVDAGKTEPEREGDYFAEKVVDEQIMFVVEGMKECDAERCDSAECINADEPRRT
jgi:hypothetical protein